MNAEIHVQIDYPRENIEDGWIQDAATAALTAAGTRGVIELTITVTGGDELLELNQKYRQINSSTDVLSFADGSVNPENGRLYLGDVVIAYPVAEAQAAQDGHSTGQELQLLVVHGVLHLLGFDHHYDPGRTRMWTIQKIALKALSSPIDSQNWQ